MLMKLPTTAMYFCVSSQARTDNSSRYNSRLSNKLTAATFAGSKADVEFDSFL